MTDLKGTCCEVKYSMERMVRRRDDSKKFVKYQLSDVSKTDAEIVWRASEVTVWHIF